MPAVCPLWNARGGHRTSLGRRALESGATFQAWFLSFSDRRSAPHRRPPLASVCHAACLGSITSNVVPESSAEHTRLCPPCAVTIARSDGQAEPDALCPSSEVPRASGSNIVLCMASDIGFPRLCTLSVTLSSVPLGSRLIGPPPPCWIALPTRFVTTCASRSASHPPLTFPLTRSRK